MDRSIQVGGSVEHAILATGDGATINVYLAPKPEVAVSYARHHFDRSVQKKALLPALKPGTAALLHLRGEAGQGHALLSEFCFQTLRDANQVRRITIRDWPRLGRAEERVSELCERIAKRWFPEAIGKTGVGAGDFVALARRLAAAEAGGLLVEHVIASPTRGDVGLLRAYLDTVWRPLFSEPRLSPAPTLLFQLRLAERSRLGRWLCEMLHLSDRGACLGALGALSAFSQEVALSFPRVPELDPLSLPDLTALYPRAPDEDLAGVRAKAEALHRATNGRFDAVVDQLFPSEAV